MSDFPFDVPTIAPSNNVTGVEYAGETLTLTRADDSTLTTTIASGALPFSHTTSVAIVSSVVTAKGTDDDTLEIDELETSITPTSTSQKVVLNLNMLCAVSASSWKCNIMIQRTIAGGSPVLLTPPPIAGLTNRYQANGFVNFNKDYGNATQIAQSCVMLVDEPGTTSQVTYLPILTNTVASTGNQFVFTLNSSYDTTADSPYYQNSKSTMTLECK
jgi:hypothetical protein